MFQPNCISLTFSCLSYFLVEDFIKDRYYYKISTDFCLSFHVFSAFRLRDNKGCLLFFKHHILTPFDSQKKRIWRDVETPKLFILSIKYIRCLFDHDNQLNKICEVLSKFHSLRYFHRSFLTLTNESKTYMVWKHTYLYH